jgi:pyruvate/2-oxoglutarate dehydrogenase complex dihydrolipoamide dehydrogenase (E3) component
MTFDVFIIGGGQAGIPLAWALAKKGWQVALAERKFLGGSCVNFGCTPTKAAIASARVAHLARRGAEFGLKIPDVTVDFPAVIERARGIALESRHSHESALQNSENPRWLRGHARLEGPNRVRVGDEIFETKQIVLNTGNRSTIPPIPGLQDCIHAGNWLDHDRLPERLRILGGGVIGIEMAQFYRRMGSAVSVWEEGPRILSHEDEDISTSLQGFLEKEGIEFHLNSKVESIPAGEQVFVATGRTPNTGDLGLETAGVECDPHGIVKVDRRLSTNVPGIWVAGDIRGGPMFTHTAWDDYRILLSQMAGDKSRTTDRIVPYAVFTDPELGRVGLTETEAKEQGRKFRVQRFELKKNGKARELGETNGFIKVLTDEASGQIIGTALLCSDAGELVHMYIDLMNAAAPASVIRNAVHIHPTLAEAVQSAVTV